MDRKQEKGILLKIDTSIYSKDAIMETSYKFTNEYYIKIDFKNSICLIRITPKNCINDNINIKREFNNELVDQQIRYRLRNETTEIRNIIIKKAFSSFEDNEKKLNE